MSTSIEQFNTFNGILGLVAAVVVLSAIGLTCRYKRDSNQDPIASFFQTWFHNSLFASVFTIGIDHVAEALGAWSYMTVYLSPPFSDFSMVCTALFWAGYRMRKLALRRKGQVLGDDLVVRLAVRNEEPAR